MLKPFVITYVKHGNVCDYNKSEKVMATSEKMALKKFFNHKEFGDKRTRRQWMDYEREVNGITYSDFKVIAETA